MEPIKHNLLQAHEDDINTEKLTFTGIRGDASRHLSREALEAALEALPPAPRDHGQVDLLVARGPNGERQLLTQALLTIDGGMPGDRWVDDPRYGVDYQLATTRTDFARVVANGQPLELHGDNLFLSLDLSNDNLPIGSVLQLGDARVRVTPVAHNGCKKWVQRFGLHPLQLNLAPTMLSFHLRGIYLQVIENGLVKVGDSVRVLTRTPLATT